MSEQDGNEVVMAVAEDLNREPDACPCGHSKEEDHVIGVGCMAPAEFHTGDVFCACPWPLDAPAHQQPREEG